MGEQKMNLVNLKEFIKYHPYHISTFAGFANITQELLEATLAGEDELTLYEVWCMAKYTGVPCQLLICPRKIMLNKSRYRHRVMIQTLHNNLYTIWDAEKGGSLEASRYMKYKRRHLVNLMLDFQNNGEVSYCRYLGIKEEVDQCLLFISNEKRKPRVRMTTKAFVEMAGGVSV